MRGRGTVIVGASQAGLQIATSLRESGYEDPILMIGAERHPPYQRPPLSKTFIKSVASVSDLVFRNEDFYAARKIDVALAQRVTDIDLPRKMLSTDRGATYSFDHLALTVGGRARAPRIPGGDFAGVFTLRDAEDAASIREGFEAASSVVLIGGGFIGLEVAATARALGKATTVLEASPRLMGRSVTAPISAFFAAAHARRGIDIRFNTAPDSIEGSAGRVKGVRLSDGTRLAADMVIISVGIEPRTELAEAAGLVCRGGIQVDEFGRTSVPGVVAAGDCTVHHHRFANGHLIRLESVQNAIDQGKAAARALTGNLVAHDNVPWFWSDQGDIKLQIAGLPAPGDATVIRGDATEERFSVLHFRDQRLTAVESVNSPADHMAGRRLIAAGASIARTIASDSAIPLKTLLP